MNDLGGLNVLRGGVHDHARLVDCRRSVVAGAEL
jgi:hypothetical protein